MSEIKLIIAGSRTVHPTIEQIDEWVSRNIDAEGCRVDEVVSGTAEGADQAGERWAEARDIPIKRFPADWRRHGKVAGKLRNREMADYGTEALVFWDGMSSGSCDMVTRMVARGKPVAVVPTKSGYR